MKTSIEKGWRLPAAVVAAGLAGAALSGCGSDYAETAATTQISAAPQTPAARVHTPAVTKTSASTESTRPTPSAKPSPVRTPAVVQHDKATVKKSGNQLSVTITNNPPGEQCEPVQLKMKANSLSTTIKTCGGKAEMLPALPKHGGDDIRDFVRKFEARTFKNAVPRTRLGKYAGCTLLEVQKPNQQLMGGKYEVRCTIDKAGANTSIGAYAPGDPDSAWAVSETTGRNEITLRLDDHAKDEFCVYATRQGERVPLAVFNATDSSNSLAIDCPPGLPAK
ncbi:MAG TPA: hypothetical protein VFL85_03290 [Candidatus Saccharimonadales bacterium]|nr:hypothetical protein [Candidatus Saccharimonadales bacterium]